MTRPEIVAALEAKGWMDMGAPYEESLISPDRDLCLEVFDAEWCLRRFTDSDVDGVAVGRYRSIDEGEDLSEVLEAVKCAEMGVPRDVDERDVDVEGPADNAPQGPVIEDGGVEDIEHETDLAYEYADQKLTGMREDGDD